MVSTYVNAARASAPGAELTTTHEGGTAFALDKWRRLERFLILGSEGGTYYVGERELTRDTASVVRECLAENGRRVITAIYQISASGRAPKSDPAIFALAMATHPAFVGDRVIRSLAYQHVPLVCRTGTHILHFAAYRKALGAGWGRGMRRAIGAWFTEKTPRDLAYQAVKYPSRDGWSLRDLLRLAHPHHAGRDTLPNWYVRGYITKGIENLSLVSEAARGTDWGDFLATIEVIKRSYTERTSHWLADRIREYKIPREALPTEILNDRLIWEALLEDMPMTAMLRNLGKMASVNVLESGMWGEGQVVFRLGDAERLRKARIHPIALLAALKVYEQGHGDRGKLTWTPSRRIVTALDEAFYASFGLIPATGKRVRLALDVSASMDGNTIAGMSFLTAREGAAAMALVTANVEPNHSIVAFSDTMVEVLIRPTMRIDEVVRVMKNVPFGGTYCALPILDAIQQKDRVDAFVTYTDIETMDGSSYQRWGRGRQYLRSSHEALLDYRDRTGIPARSVVVGMTSNGFTVADPRDPLQLDVVGFDASTPGVISDFIGGTL